MFHYEIIEHPPSFSLDQEKIEEIFRTIPELVADSQNGIINISFVSDEDMRRLNHEYRKIDKTTDVLSFHYFEDFTHIKTDEVAGEILLSESKIISQAEKHDHSKDKEAYILIIHGILHILGYDHETDEEYEEMQTVEIPLRNRLGL